jgi:hypothetical protein
MVRGEESRTDVECRVLGIFMLEAAMGNAWIGSVGGDSSWRGCGMKAAFGEIRLVRGYAKGGRRQEIQEAQEGEGGRESSDESEMRLCMIL